MIWFEISLVVLRINYNRVDISHHIFLLLKLKLRYQFVLLISAFYLEYCLVILSIVNKNLSNWATNQKPLNFTMLQSVKLYSVVATSLVSQPESIVVFSHMDILYSSFDYTCFFLQDREHHRILELIKNLFDRFLITYICSVDWTQIRNS